MEYSALNIHRAPTCAPDHLSWTRVSDESSGANALFGSFDAFKDLGNATESVLWQHCLRTLRDLRACGEENLKKLFENLPSGQDLHRRLVVRMNAPLHPRPWSL